MDFKVTWTDAASADLQEIVDYIRRFDSAAAKRLGEEIISHSEILASFPFIGPSFPRDSEGNQREVVCRNYRIFYRIREAEQIVDIVAVRHGASEPPPLS